VTWTDYCQGNAQYMGWDPEAYTQFDQLCLHIQFQREAIQSEELEQSFHRRQHLVCAMLRGEVLKQDNA
jgi:hypothetical protein